ncbi:MAG: hypothetical protein WA957_06550 [Alteraurantiacibacter sp.]
MAAAEGWRYYDNLGAVAVLGLASTLSLLAAGLYLLVMLAALAAFFTARKHGQQDWHVRSWLLVAALFTLLCLARIFSIEELVQEIVRQHVRSNGTYLDRDEWQRPVAAGLIVISTAFAGFAVFRTFRTIRGRRNFAVAFVVYCAFAMLALIATRLISLHTLDRLLYGPLKLNWIADIGLSGAIAAAAFYYTRIIRFPPRARR